MVTRKTKPKCGPSSTACGYACITSKKNCSSVVLARDAAELIKAATATQSNSIKTYAEVKMLGQGAYGETYLTDRGTVVKLIKENTESEADDLVVEARREFDMLGVMYKLGIGPRPIAFDTTTGDIEMSLAAGSTMKDEYEYASDSDKVTIANNAYDAITKLHKAGYSHNDLHPGNVMFDKNNNVTIIDAGFVGKLGEPLNDYVPVSSGFKDIAKLFRSLGDPADKYYDDLTDKLDSSGALDKYRELNKIAKQMGDRPDLQAAAELYLHSEYLKVIGSD